MSEFVDEMETIVLDKYTQFKANFPIIREPRWHDETIVIQADVKKHNKIQCSYMREDGSEMFPDPLYISGTAARKFKPFDMPTRDGRMLSMRAVPIKAFKRLKLTERSMY